LWLVRNPSARRYVLRLRPDGAARVTIPRGGSRVEARQFAENHSHWLAQQLLRQARLQNAPNTWLQGTEILFRGEPVRLELTHNCPSAAVCFGDQAVKVPEGMTDLRPPIERHLWRLAARELPARVLELAALHKFPALRITVRNQRSRWGSCSRRGTISLNWRLLQAPPFVRDYIILHELAHLKEMNHSRRFWRVVARLCPDFVAAERWLKKNSHLLR
jgi:predicted metal-dependent hydrolase